MLYAGIFWNAVTLATESDYIIRQYLEEALGREKAELAASGGIAAGEKINLASLEGEKTTMMLKGIIG